MHRAFSFENAGRTFACCAEPARGHDRDLWWWFTVSSDSQRYAPFQVEAGDTERSVRERVVAYYDTMLARRAEPRRPWQRPEGHAGNGAAQGAEPPKPVG